MDVQAPGVVISSYRTSSYMSEATLTGTSYGSSSHSMGTLVHLLSREREYEESVCVHVCACVFVAHC